MTAGAGSLRRLLQGLPVFTAALSAALAGLSPIILPDQLIPEQLSILRPVSSLLILLGILMAWVHRSRLRGRLRALVTVAGIAALLMLTLQITSVVRVDGYDNPPATHHFLTGFKPTDRGRAMLERVEAVGVSRGEQIRRAGDHNIPSIYGASYWVALLLYAMSVTLFLLATMIAIGTIEIQFWSRSQRTGNQAPRQRPKAPKQSDTT